MQKQSAVWSRGVMIASFVALMVSAWTPLTAEEPQILDHSQILQIDQSYTKLELTEKSSRIIEFKGRIKTVDIGDPEVVGAYVVENPSNPRQMRITAIGPGLTNVKVTDEFGKSFMLEILINGDVRHLQTVLQMTFPDAAINVVKVKETVVLNGWVDQPSQITSIIQVVEQFFPEPINNIQVAGVQQVTLKVKVMEVQRGKIRRLGFNFFNIGDNGFLVSNPGNLVPVTGLTVPLGGAVGLEYSPGNATALFGILSETNIFQGFIEALKEESMLKILAEPNLTVKSGEKSNLLSGGEFPILVPQSLGTLSIEYKTFGVKLEALPIVLGNGRLNLQLIPEVSERDFANSVEFQGNIVPGLTTRRVQTTVEMGFGETLVLAGILFDRTTASTFKVPLLGELPVVGSLFRRVRYDQTETELLVMVTPELAAPLSAEQVPPQGPGQFSGVPNDRELYFDGTIEVPNYGSECPGCENGTSFLPSNGMITPSPDQEFNTSNTIVPPAPATPTGSSQPSLAPPAPPVPQEPQASRQGFPRSGIQQTSTRSALIQPSFTQNPQSKTSTTKRSGVPTQVAPQGATPYRTSRGNAEVLRTGHSNNQSTATPRTGNHNAAQRAKTLRETRVNRRFGHSQQPASRTSRTSQVMQNRTTPSAVPAITPQAAASIAVEKKKSTAKKSAAKADGATSPSRRTPRPGLISPSSNESKADALFGP